MRTDLWESGSEFHWPDYPPTTNQHPAPWDPQPRFYGSGRDGLRSLIQHGMSLRGWRRLLVPSYMCPEVVASAVATGIKTRAYAKRPSNHVESATELDLVDGDVVLDVNVFGLRDRSYLNIPEGIDVIEDHTHDPWSAWARKSGAAFSVASLRKVLPLPSGGVVWSPRGFPLPDQCEPTPERTTASAERLRAMILKRLYLEGHEIDTAIFRALARSGESNAAIGPISGMPSGDRVLLSDFPADEWRSTRLRNYLHLRGLLNNHPQFELLEAVGTGSVPFSLILVFGAAAMRDFVRHRLMESRVYPAILWDLQDHLTPGMTIEDADLSRRLLSLHVDWRYGPSDMGKVAAILAATLADADGIEFR